MEEKQKTGRKQRRKVERRSKCIKEENVGKRKKNVRKKINIRMNN